jgi:methylglutaconyl-CoA hydratase
LISEAVVEEELHSTIEKLIQQLLKNSPAAISAAKQIIFDVQDSPITLELLAMTSERIANIRVSEQGQEGLNAFLNKRRANWVEK